MLQDFARQVLADSVYKCPGSICLDMDPIGFVFFTDKLACSPDLRYYCGILVRDDGIYADSAFPKYSGDLAVKIIKTGARLR